MSVFKHLKSIFRQADHSSVSMETEREENEIPTQLDRIEDSLRKLHKRERRQGQTLDFMQEDLSFKLNKLLRFSVQNSTDIEAILSFAHDFILFGLSQAKNENSWQSIWSSFLKMLDHFEIEPIIGLHQKFDDSLHQVCQVRWDPEHSEGIVLEVVQPGFYVSGQLHKTAVVVVNKNPQPTESETQQGCE